MQVLKQTTKEKISNAALEVFYEKGFKSTTLREIARRAEIPVGLIYVYYKSKEDMFEDIVKPVLHFVTKGLTETSHIQDKSEKQIQEKKLLMNLFRHRKEMIILIDKSAGSKYECAKEKLANELELHILNDIKQYHDDYDEVYAKILATCTIESVIMLAKHYKDDAWLEKSIKFVTDTLFLKKA